MRTYYAQHDSLYNRVRVSSQPPIGDYVTVRAETIDDARKQADRVFHDDVTDETIARWEEGQ